MSLKFLHAFGRSISIRQIALKYILTPLLFEKFDVFEIGLIRNEAVRYFRT